MSLAEDMKALIDAAQRAVNDTTNLSYDRCSVNKGFMADLLYALCALAADPQDARITLAHEIAVQADEYRDLYHKPYPSGGTARLQAEAELDAASSRLDALLARYFGDNDE